MGVPGGGGEASGAAGVAGGGKAGVPGGGGEVLGRVGVAGGGLREFSPLGGSGGNVGFLGGGEAGDVGGADAPPQKMAGGQNSPVQSPSLLPVPPA